MPVPFTELGSIFRIHIVAIAAAAALVFGWLFSGEYLWIAAVLGAVDWLLINLLNRISDTEEDLENQIAGAERVARARRRYLVGWWLLQAASLGGGFLLASELLPFRLVVQAIGIGYSYRIVPTLRGLRRFKDIYFLKNFMSSVLFVLTVFCYPLAMVDWQVRLRGGWPAVIALVVFFVVFEITYEILYDMRDLEGDRRVGVPTYPVVHGLHRSRQIVDVLLGVSAGVVIVSVLTGLLGVREFLFVAAPTVQWLFYRPRFERGLTSADCIWLTHVGTFMLVFFLVGTHFWLRLGLPENVFV